MVTYGNSWLWVGSTIIKIRVSYKEQITPAFRYFTVRWFAPVRSTQVGLPVLHPPLTSAFTSLHCICTPVYSTTQCSVSDSLSTDPWWTITAEDLQRKVWKFRYNVVYTALFTYSIIDFQILQFTTRLLGHTLYGDTENWLRHIWY